MLPSHLRLSSRCQYKNLVHICRNICLMVFLVSGIAVLTPRSSAQRLLPGLIPADSIAAVVPQEVLVGVRADLDDAQEANRLNAVAGLTVGWQPELHAYRIRLQPGMTIEAAMARFQRLGEVVYAEPNHIYHVQSTPNNLYYGNQYGPHKVQADLAWDIWNPSATIVIAIVDTGIDNTHPALTNKIYRDALGIVGYNAFTGLRDNASDDYGHGTHCAGIAAAQINNGIGVAGLAGWNGQASQSDTTYTKLMPVKVLDGTGSGSDVSVANGILWAANNGARVISLSLGGSSSSTTLSNAVSYAWTKGCVIVAAAGNSGVSTLSYPGAYPNVISVAATDSNDQLAGFSNYGSWVKVAAPGVSIYSTVPTYAAGGNFGLNYNYLSGTSMATPHVAGEAALILAQNPALTNSQVSALITSNVDPYTPSSGGIAAGSGRINVYRALLAAGGGAARVPNAPGGMVAASGNTQVILSWNVTAGAASYNVKRSLVSSGPYTSLATGGTTTTYTDTGLPNGTTYYYVVTAVNTVGESPNSAQVSAVPSTQSSLYRIDSGGGATGTFSADNYFTGGGSYSGNDTIDTAGVANAAPTAVYQSIRGGIAGSPTFAYTIPNLTAGTTYTVRLHFAELWVVAPGQRTFNVAVNGTSVLPNFDIVAASGARFKAVVRDVLGTADSNGNLTINFTKGNDYPIVSGIEVIGAGSPPPAAVPAAPTGLQAMAGNAQVTLSWNTVSGASGYNVYHSQTSGSGYTLIGSPTSPSSVDNNLTNGTTYYYVVTAVNTTGESIKSVQVSATPAAQTTLYRINAGGGATGTFSADNYFTGGGSYSGNDTIDTAGVANAAPTAVYQSIRGGIAGSPTFAYTIPSLTAGTTYTVRLHFAELWVVAAGQRTFNVAVNGTSVLPNFDIVAASGARFKAVVRDVLGTADSNGNLTINFTKGNDYPIVSGIEVIH